MTSLAAAAEVPVFPVVGAGGRTVAEELPLLPGVRVADSPRAATILLVIGRVTRALLRPLLAVHDQLAPPRASMHWPVGPFDDEVAEALPGIALGRPGGADELRRLHGDLLRGRRPSDSPALLDIEPARWRGVGPYGTGGTGMTGGVPYGRPLPGRADDPDGLALDQLPVQLGPFFPALPPGLVLDLGVQGDVIRTAAVGPNPYDAWPGDPPPGPLDTAPFLGALYEPTSIAGLEVARAQHHLRWLASVLRLHGLAALGTRSLDLASRLTAADGTAVERLARRLRRSRSLRSATTGVGVLAPGVIESGPVGRAAGDAVDGRLDDPSYATLGFEPVLHHEGDAWSRLLQRLGEAQQALDLAERAGERIRDPGPPLEGPRGALAIDGGLPSGALMAVLPDAITGLEWADAMAAVASLDVDVEEAAASPVSAPSP